MRTGREPFGCNYYIALSAVLAVGSTIAAGWQAGIYFVVLLVILVLGRRLVYGRWGR